MYKYIYLLKSLFLTFFILHHHKFDTLYEQHLEQKKTKFRIMNTAYTRTNITFYKHRKAGNARWSYFVIRHTLRY